MAGPIFSVAFTTELLLLSFADLKLFCIEVAKNFCLMASENNADYRVKLTDTHLKIPKVKVSPSISMSHEIRCRNDLLSTQYISSRTRVSSMENVLQETERYICVFKRL